MTDSVVNVVNITDNWQRLRAEIDSVDSAAASVTLIAVSKTFPAQMVRAAHEAGACEFGENYLQEAEEKIDALADLPLTWHFIGRLQKNKTARVARRFDWVHGVDSLPLARRLSDARAGEGRVLNVFMQVNISREEGKAGVAPEVETAAALAREIAALPNLHLRGLMVLPAAETDAGRQYEAFRRTADLQQEIIDATGIALDCLSMGMSGDYAQALRAGATHVRIGSAIFGARAAKNNAE